MHLMGPRVTNILRHDGGLPRGYQILTESLRGCKGRRCSKRVCFLGR